LGGDPGAQPVPALVQSVERPVVHEPSCSPGREHAGYDLPFRLDRPVDREADGDFDGSVGDGAVEREGGTGDIHTLGVEYGGKTSERGIEESGDLVRGHSTVDHREFLFGDVHKIRYGALRKVFVDHMSSTVGEAGARIATAGYRCDDADLRANSSLRGPPD